MDGLKIHELMTSLQEDGTCQLTHLDGEKVKLHISKDIVIKALLIQEGNHMFNGMKLTPQERKVAFKGDTANESVYDNLREEAIKLPLQILQ